MQANKSYSAVLRAYDAQAEQMQRNQFQMRIEMKHMENYLKNGSNSNNNPSMRMDERRFSNTVKPENFYDYEHGGDEHITDDDERENRPSASPYHFNRIQSDYQYSSPVVDSKSNPDSILTPTSSSHLHHQKNTIDADFQKALQLDLEHMKQQKEDAEQQWQAACDKIEQLEQLNTSLAIELSKTKQETDTIKASLIQVTDTADTSRRLQDREKVLRAAAQRKADLADQRMKELTVERDTIASALKEERDRARKLRRKSLGFDPPADDATLEQLLSEMEIQRKLLESAEYRMEWRENTVKNMDLCLQILFVCERDIVMKKKKFMAQSAKKKNKRKTAVELLTANKTGSSSSSRTK